MKLVKKKRGMTRKSQQTGRCRWMTTREPTRTSMSESVSDTGETPVIRVRSRIRKEKRVIGLPSTDRRAILHWELSLPDSSVTTARQPTYLSISSVQFILPFTCFQVQTHEKMCVKMTSVKMTKQREEDIQTERCLLMMTLEPTLILSSPSRESTSPEPTSSRSRVRKQ